MFKKYLYLILLALFLSGCGFTTPVNMQKPVSTNIAERHPTQSQAIHSNTSLPTLLPTASTTPLPPTFTFTPTPIPSTATPTLSPSPTFTVVPPTSILPPGREAYFPQTDKSPYPHIPYVVVYDPTVWNVGANDELNHKHIEECHIQISWDLSLDKWDHIFRVSVGSWNWNVYESDVGLPRLLFYRHIQEPYSKYEEKIDITLFVKGIENPQCQADVQVVLGEIIPEWEYFAQSTPIATATPTPQPIPNDYICESLPPLLHVGELAYVIGDSVWLRSEPKLSAETQIRLLQYHEPVALEITGGPVCNSSHTYWQVGYVFIRHSSFTISEPPSGPYEPTEGWIAEASDTTYFLEKWLP